MLLSYNAFRKKYSQVFSQRLLLIMVTLLMVGAVMPNVAFAEPGDPPREEPTPIPTFTPIPRPTAYPTGDDRSEETYRFRPEKYWQLELNAQRNFDGDYDYVMGGNARLGYTWDRYLLSVFGGYMQSRRELDFQEEVTSENYHAGLELDVGFGSQDMLPYWFEPYVRLSLRTEFVRQTSDNAPTVELDDKQNFWDLRGGAGVRFRPAPRAGLCIYLGADYSMAFGDELVSGGNRLMAEAGLSLWVAKIFQVFAEYQAVVPLAEEENFDFSNFLPAIYGNDVGTDTEFFFTQHSARLGLIFHL